MSEDREQYTTKREQAALAKRGTSDSSLMVFDRDGSNHLYKLAQTLSESDLVPAHFRGKPANAFIAVEMAQRLQVAPFMVLQNLYIVKGKPGWSSQFLIAMANRSGTFKGAIKFEEFGSDDNLEVVAYAFHADTGERVESKVSMKMAKAEGWTSNPKYQSMPVQMLRYRAATFLVRTFCPEVCMGIPTQDEIETIPDDEITVSPVIGVPQDNAQQEQIRIAQESAVDAGVPPETVEGLEDAKAVYAAIQAHKEAQAVEEAVEEVVEDQQAPALDGTKEVSESKSAKYKTLQALAEKMDQAQLAEALASRIEAMSAVERSAYGKIAGFEVGKDDLNTVDMDGLRGLYIAVEIESQVQNEMSFA